MVSLGVGNLIRSAYSQPSPLKSPWMKHIRCPQSELGRFSRLYRKITVTLAPSHQTQYYATFNRSSRLGLLFSVLLLLPSSDDRERHAADGESKAGQTPSLQGILRQRCCYRSHGIILILVWLMKMGRGTAIKRKKRKNVFQFISKSICIRMMHAT